MTERKKILDYGMTTLEPKKAEAGYCDMNVQIDDLQPATVGLIRWSRVVFFDAQNRVRNFCVSAALKKF